MKLKIIYQKVLTESLTNYPSKLCHEPNPSRVPRKPHVIGYHAQSTWTLKCDNIACNILKNLGVIITIENQRFGFDIDILVELF